MEGKFETMLSREEAVKRVLAERTAALTHQEVTSVSIDAINGQTTAAPIVASTDVPARNFATMDGYAIDATDEYPLIIAEEHEVFPEDAGGSLSPGTAVKIATGAPLPNGANAVVKREDTTVSGTHLNGKSISPWTYVQRRGSSVRAGETLFSGDERLSPKDALLLGELGHEEIAVNKPFRVGILATGTEFVEENATDLDSPMLVGLINSWGHDPTWEPPVHDSVDSVKHAIDQAAKAYDVVVTTGGTSVGHKDFVIRALNELGSVVFHQVRIRPGKPIALARLPEQAATVFAIPGKPFGAHTISTTIMRPFFVGETPSPTLTAKVTQSIEFGVEGFEYVIPVTLSGTNPIKANPLGHVDSPLKIYDDIYDPSVLSSHTRTSRAEGVIVTETPLTAGDDVAVHPYRCLE